MPRRVHLFGIPKATPFACVLAVSLLSAEFSGTPKGAPRAPETFQVRVQTTKGVMRWEIHRAWSPNGVDRFYQLVRIGYYDGNRFFRVIPNKWAQFGINGNPKIASTWRTKTIPDDPRVESNVRGTIAYAFAVPNGRTTQLFINLRDNRPTHDKEPFVPIGKVMEGMNVADALYSGYGESAGGGIRAGHQDAMFNGGDAYFEANFPLLDSIGRVTVVRE
jgi:peptidyl-prolyl cis-trans isomerase A (cyclophilin A)